MSSDSEDSDSILPNLQKTRDLWNQKSEGESLDYLIPKTPSPTKQVHSPLPGDETHMNGTASVVRAEDKKEDDFDMPDVKSMKSQWEKAGPTPVPKKTAPLIERKHATDNHETPELVPVNREPEENKEEYDVKLGALREKFELEAKAASSTKVVWNDEKRSSVSKASVGQKKDLFEGEIEAQKHYQSTKEGTVEMPAVELSSIKQQFEQRKDEKLVVPTKQSSTNRKARQISISSDSSGTPAAEVVRYDDPPAEEVKYEVEISSLRKRFEQAASNSAKPMQRSKPTVQKKVSNSEKKAQSPERKRAASESEYTTEIVKSSEAKYDEMIGEESVKDRLARYKAMTEANKPQKTQKFAYNKRRATADLPIRNKPLEVEVREVTTEEQPQQDQQEIVRSPPAGTKEKPDYKASIDLEQARQLFEEKSASPTRSGRSSRSSSRSPLRRSPRSQSTPSPINRVSSARSSSSSKSPSPVRPASRSSQSSRSSGRQSPTKKTGDPDVVVLEHTEVNYYYEDGSRLSTKTKGLEDLDKSQTEEMSDADVIKPAPAGTKEEVDFVPSINLHSVRTMFENPKEEDFSRGRAPPKKVVIERQPEQESTSASPERNPEIVRSSTAGVREEVAFEMSIDLKSARSKFESPHRQDNYVPRNKIKEREEEMKKKRAAVAAASPRSSESSDSGYEVVKNTEAGSKEKPEYQVDLKAAKQMFEGGRAPAPVQRETKPRQQVEIVGDVVRPEPAGTKEVVMVQSPNDVKSVKMRFENPNAEEVSEEEMRQKSPIDIQEEVRNVMRKEREVKEEVQKSNDEPAEVEKHESSSDSESEHTDTEGKVVLQPEETPDVVVEAVEERRHSVSSEELVECEIEHENEVIEEEEEDPVDEAQQENPEVEPEQENLLEESEQGIQEEETTEEKEYAEEEPAAAVVPVRVAIPEDLTGKTEETEPAQDYGTYAKVIDYNEEVQHPPESSDSESEKEVEQKGVEDDGLKQNGYKEENADSSYESNEVGNHLDDSVSSDDQKGISSISSNPDQQQLSLSSSSPAEEIAGKTSTNTKTDNIDVPTNPQPSSDPFADLSGIVGPPQLTTDSQPQPDPFFGGDSSNDPFGVLTSNPAPPPRRTKIIDPKPAVDSTPADTSDDEDFDKPHFNYPYEEDENSPAKSSEVINPNNNSNNSNGLDAIFGGGFPSTTTDSKPPVTAVSNADLLGGFDPAPTVATTGNSADLLADFGGFESTAPSGSTPEADPFDIFAQPAKQESGSGEKDPFDLFA